MLRMPASLAALRPGAESSITQQARGETPIQVAACRKRSGKGFPLATSSLLYMLPSKKDNNPAEVSDVRIFWCVPLEATQTFLPNARITRWTEDCGFKTPLIASSVCKTISSHIVATWLDGHVVSKAPHLLGEA